MRYAERKEFLYDPLIFKRSDTVTALRIHAEYVLKQSAIPRPKFFEVDRAEQSIDPLWHMPVTERTVFTRTMEIPAITTFDKGKWSMRKEGQRPSQLYRFWLANLHLCPADSVPSFTSNDWLDRPDVALARQQVDTLHFDYFPQRGDMVEYAGYRLMIMNAIPDPTAYWGQTNVWLGIICEAKITPEGDARPVVNVRETAPAEQPGAPAMADWPGQPPTGPTPHSWP